mgnify:CR=1 FL=1
MVILLMAAPPSQVWYPYHTIAGSPRIRLGTTFPFVPNALRSCTAYGARLVAELIVQRNADDQDQGTNGNSQKQLCQVQPSFKLCRTLCQRTNRDTAAKPEHCIGAPAHNPFLRMESDLRMALSCFISLFFFASLILFFLPYGC